jgi:putative spermidine/putrescine transport system permease protein
MRGRENRNLLLMVLPALIVGAAFFLIPLARLAVVGGGGGGLGLEHYLAVITNRQYFEALVSTIVLSILVTAVTLAIAGISGVFLERNRFLGREALVSMLTLPLAFPGVVIGFMVIMLAGRTGLIGDLTSLFGVGRLVFAYSMVGLFTGYIYFSIPRVILTIMAAAEKLDPALEEAARSLGAGPWRVVRDVILPALAPALTASGAVCFATSMGAFGTAFTLATDIKVLPIVIYTEFTLLANIATAAALSIVLGAITWITLAASRAVAGATAAAAG